MRPRSVSHVVPVALVVLALLPIAAQAQSYAYVANAFAANNVSAYSINTSTGALTPIAGSPFPTGGMAPFALTVDPVGGFVYVANQDSSNVSAFAINPSTGALTQITGSPFAAGHDPESVTVDPSGRFVYVANNASANISAYTINPGTGALTPIAGSPFAGAAGPNCVRVDPSGQFLYVANIFGTVSAYTIDPNTGALTPIAGSPFSSPTEATSVIVDPTGRFAYVTEGGSGQVSAYSINPGTGALTAIAGSPFDLGLGNFSGPYSVTVDPSGRFAYVVTQFANFISAYTIDPSTGALTQIAGSPFATDTHPVSVTVDPSGQFVYTANQNGGDVSAFSINPTTGALTPIAGSPFPAKVGASSVATVTFAAVPAQDGAYQIGYAANLNIGDSVVNLSNDGANGGFVGANPPTAGNLCVNVYAFDPQEEEIACCSCLVTPNGLNSLSAKNDLISNPLTPAIPTSIVIKLVASRPAADPTGALTVCNPATIALTRPGLLAWGSTLEPAVSPGAYAAVSVPFLNGALNPSELAALTSTCSFIQSDATGYGICNSCRTGALGGAKK